MDKEKKKLPYDPPVIEIVRFELEDSIASSADHGPDAACSEWYVD